MSVLKVIEPCAFELGNNVFKPENIVKNFLQKEDMKIRKFLNDEKIAWTEDESYSHIVPCEFKYWHMCFFFDVERSSVYVENPDEQQRKIIEKFLSTNPIAKYQYFEKENHIVLEPFLYGKEVGSLGSYFLIHFERNLNNDFSEILVRLIGRMETQNPPYFKKGENFHFLVVENYCVESIHFEMLKNIFSSFKINLMMLSEII